MEVETVEKRPEAADAEVDGGAGGGVESAASIEGIQELDGSGTEVIAASANIELIRSCLPRSRAKATALIAVLLSLAAGLLAGAGLARALVSKPGVAVAIPCVSMPAVLILGYQVWRARAAALLLRGFLPGLSHALRSWTRGSRLLPVQRLEPDKENLPRVLEQLFQKASAFGHVGVILGIVSGLLCGLSAGGDQFLLVFLAFSGLHGVYGLSLVHLASTGYLPPPEDF